MKAASPLRWAGALLFVQALITAPRPSFAEGMEPCQFRQAQDVVACALERHPDILAAANTETRDRQLVSVARQRPNPEIESRLLGGKSADDSLFTTETTLFTVWELGGKRRSRTELAEAQGRAAKADLAAVREAVLLETTLALFRLRQIRGELAGIDETIGTFGKIIRLYKARPFLTPEQEVSLTSFELAKEDYKLKKGILSQDRENLLGSLRIATQSPLENIATLLPAPMKQWPKLETNHGPEAPANAQTEKARAQQSEAETKLRLAKSEAWPDLRIGPTLETESLSAATKVTGGLHFALPLPILNRNQGGQAYAQADKIRAESVVQVTAKKIAVEREVQASRYRAALRALAQTASPSGLSSQHEKVEAFFEKGLVPSTLVIETHRQLYDLTKTRNEQELAGIEALWRVKILDGEAL